MYVPNDFCSLVGFTEESEVTVAMVYWRKLKCFPALVSAVWGT